MFYANYNNIIVIITTKHYQAKTWKDGDIIAVTVQPGLRKVGPGAMAVATTVT